VVVERRAEGMKRNEAGGQVLGITLEEMLAVGSNILGLASDGNLRYRRQNPGHMTWLHPDFFEFPPTKALKVSLKIMRAVPSANVIICLPFIFS
jgi:hypothetical protein